MDTNDMDESLRTVGPMDCTDVKALLSALIDDEVDGTTRHRAERHLVQCDACRSLITEAESIDELVVADALALEPGELPVGFEGAVLGRTIYDRTRRPFAERWTTWLGWLAAAAAIALATTIWMIDRPGRVEHAATTGGTETTLLAPVVYGPAPALKASLFKDDRRSRGSGAGAALTPILPGVSAEDGDTLFAASSVLELLAAADLEGFADVERIRRIVEYDDLLPRLASARERIPHADRPVVLATESILTRIVRGPLSTEDLQNLRETALRLELGSMTAQMSDRCEPAAL